MLRKSFIKSIFQLNCSIIEFDFFEGENKRARILIVICYVPPVPRGVPKIEVLTVNVKRTIDGKEIEELKCEFKTYNLSDDAIRLLIANAEKYKKKKKKKKKKINAN